MNERLFIQTVNDKSRELGINPLLLMSGIEGLYTFREVPLSGMNHNFLDSLILTIFALRIGDGFHSLAEQQLSSASSSQQLSAIHELTELPQEAIDRSANPYLQSFARILGGKTAIRNYHVKALEVAALEINRAQQQFRHQSIGTIVLGICRIHLRDSLDLGQLFGHSSI